MCVCVWGGGGGSLRPFDADACTPSAHCRCRCPSRFVSASTFEEALWPRHLEYEAAVGPAGAGSGVTVLSGEEPAEVVLAAALAIVRPWAVSRLGLLPPPPPGVADGLGELGLPQLGHPAQVHGQSFNQQQPPVFADAAADRSHNLHRSCCTSSHLACSLRGRRSPHPPWTLQPIRGGYLAGTAV